MSNIKVKQLDVGVEITLATDDAEKLLAVLLEPRVPLYPEEDLNNFRRRLAGLIQVANKDLFV